VSVLIHRLADKVEQSVALLDPKDPFAIANNYAEARASQQSGYGRLVFWRGSFWTHRGSAYQEEDVDGLKSDLWRWMASAKKPSQEGGALSFKPNKTIVDNVSEALKAVCTLSNDIAPPAWIEEAVNLPPAGDLLPVANGALDLRNLSLLPPDPNLFALTASPVSYEPGAGEPVEFLKFLRSVWPDDPEATSTLQEWFGYCLTADTRQQKILLIIGPPRSGKGTLQRVLTALLGQGNVASPMLGSFANNFGLQPLIGKSVAIVSDARLGGRSDQHAIVERLLSISGEDSLTIDRKYRPAWTGKLSTRLILMSNEMPRLSDASNAITNRYIVLPMRKTFLGCEDHGLLDRLMRELPAILEWSLAGLARLRERGRFMQPRSGQAMIDELMELASPVQAFVNEWCELGPEREVAKADIFRSYSTWAAANGHHSPTKGTFGRDLRAQLPGLENKKARMPDGRREQRYVGIALREGAPGLLGPSPVHHWSSSNAT